MILVTMLPSVLPTYFGPDFAVICPPPPRINASLRPSVPHASRPQEYLEKTDKYVYYEKDCSGSHCNMFGIGYDCRGCYNDCATCETFLWEEQMS